jgi:hypothetical protein
MLNEIMNWQDALKHYGPGPSDLQIRRIEYDVNRSSSVDVILLNNIRDEGRFIILSDTDSMIAPNFNLKTSNSFRERKE